MRRPALVETCFWSLGRRFRSSELGSAVAFSTHRGDPCRLDHQSCKTRFSSPIFVGDGRFDFPMSDKSSMHSSTLVKRSGELPAKSRFRQLQFSVIDNRPRRSLRGESRDLWSSWRIIWSYQAQRTSPDPPNCIKKAFSETSAVAISRRSKCGEANDLKRDYPSRKTLSLHPALPSMNGCYAVSTMQTSCIA